MPGETDESHVPGTPGSDLAVARRDGPDTEEEEDPSSVRPSAPTLQGTASTSDPPVAQRPVIVRTPTPPAPTPRSSDRAPDANTTAITGEDPAPSDARVTAAMTPRSSGVSSSPRGLIGAVLGRYEIIEELGHGGMATVYRARDPRLERDVALKVIHRHLRDNKEIAQRFRHEARAVAKLKHPSIVEIYDVPDEAEEGERFLVAELVEGPSLRKYLQNVRLAGDQQAPTMPAEMAAALVLQVLSALARAHEEGIIHRDVKPENILVSGLTGPTSQRPSDPARTPPVVKLTDFGIAKILDAQGMTSTGQILGSPAHMAPEQIEGGEITARVDIFATGVLFYELVTGGLPFDGKNPAQVIRRVLDGTFTAADRLVPTVGGRWSAIIAAMLARDQEKRPASAEAMAQHIRAELDALGVTDPNKVLFDYLRDPSSVAEGWGEHLKPRLVERAAAAREQGDVVGASNDLNRALAYDPLDPKLMRAVGTLRSRERRLRTLRRALVLILAAFLVSTGTFLGVRAMRRSSNPTTPPTVATSAVSTPLPVTVVTTTSVTSTTSIPKNDAGPAPTSVTSAVSTAVVAPPTGDAAVKLGVTRQVKLNVYPAAATVHIDGLGSHSTGQDVMLAVGEHTISAEGVANCCEPIVGQKFRVEAGDGPQVLPIKLKFNPARIFAQAPSDGGSAVSVAATITVKSSSGGIIQSGASPLSVPMNETETAVTIVVEAIGFSKKTETANLHPGDPKYVDLAPE